MNKKYSIILIILIILYLIVTSDTFKANLLVFMTIQRGILAPNCLWWNISDFFNIGTGVDLYRKLRQKHKIAPLYIAGKTINLVTDVDFIKQILDNSPNPFGVGKFKYDFFKSFMKLNVGVSQGCPWRRRRLLNDKVLWVDRKHPLEEHFKKYIDDILNNINPIDFNDFVHAGKLIAMKIVFNENKIYEPIFKVINKANSLDSIIFGDADIDSETKNKYDKFLENSINNPNKNCLVWRTKGQEYINKEALIDQVPHWIFPTAGVIGVHSLRMLAVLANHKNIIDKIIKSNYDIIYLRKCVLEMFRLNNAVNSTFRTLLKDYDFDNNYKYKKGDQFLILNSPVMRNEDIFTEPNRFIPERWNQDLENSYYALMFNQGPQRCPGKELSILIMSMVIEHFIKKTNGNIKTNVKLNINNIPEAINPCKIKIY